MLFFGRMRPLKPVAALALLCMLGALDSLRDDLLPGYFRTAAALPFAERQAIHWVTLAALALAALVLRRPRWQGGLSLLAPALTGLGLFALPAFALHAVGSRTTEFNRVALFSLTPLFAVVLEPHLGRDEHAGASRAMTSAMIAAGGAFLLFPITVPGSLLQWTACCGLLLLAAGIAAVTCWATRTLAASALFSSAVCACAVAGCFLMARVAGEPWVMLDLHMWPDAAWTSLIDFPALLLLFWLLARMSASSISLRYVLAPLITALLSLLLFRPHVALLQVAGIVAMAGGAAAMLAQRPEQQTGTNLTLGLKERRKE